MTAAIAAIDGSRIVRGDATITISDVAAAESLGVSLAKRLLAEGGDAILATARETPENGVAPAPAADVRDSLGALAGRLLLLPRTQDRPSSIAPALRGAGAEVVEAADSDAAAAALGGRTPEALLFPSSGSVRAVDAFLARLRASGIKPIVAAMGDASSAAAREAGFPPDIVASEATVGAFVHSITHYLIGNTALNGSDRT